MIVVVDASVAIKWFVAEPDHAEARALADGDHVLHAPDLLMAEVLNVAWKKAMRGESDANEAQAMPAAVMALIDTFHSDLSLGDRAIELALHYRHPAYDCFYLACAEDADAQLVTADRKLRDLVAGSALEERIRLLA